MRLTDFHMLLIEDNPTRPGPMERAARDAGLNGRIHVVHGRDEAVEYLSRRRPSLFLVNLEGSAGLDVLQWMKAQPRLRNMVKVGLLPPSDGIAVSQAYALGLNSCLARPSTSEGLATMFDSIREYWLALNHPPEL